MASPFPQGPVRPTDDDVHGGGGAIPFQYTPVGTWEVLDLRDVITFQGKSVEEIEQAFRDSVDDYLEFCEQRGEEPDKPFSGRLMLRLPPHLHRKVYVSALREGKSLNQWITERLERAC